MTNYANMLRHHREGLMRVATVIGSNPNYDDLLEYRLTDQEKALFAPGVDILDKREYAVSSFDKKLRSGSHKIIVPEFFGIACDGNTKNNLREFRFFEKICAPASIRIADKNYASCPSISASKLSQPEREALDDIAVDVRGYYSERRDISASLVRQQILYSRSFFGFLLAFSRPGAVVPTALVQANDHSPVRVALSMIMKGLGVPRVYLQHAEVTRSFPPLDFEFSVLRNRQSLETYEAIGPLAGRAFVISRYEEPFARERLARQRGEGVAVVIYPTSRVLVQELRQMVEALEHNPHVGQVLIKQHPGAAKRLNHLFEHSRIKLVDEFPADDHVAIVGNSSVAIELLHRGIPVYQYFDFDPVDRDYYGFVARGLTIEVGLADMGKTFWSPFPVDANWLEEYSRLDPTAAADHERVQEEFVSQMARLAAQVPAPQKIQRMRGSLRARFKGSIKRGLIRAVNANRVLSTFAANQVLANSQRMANFLSVNAHRAANFLLTHTDLEVSASVWTGTKRSSAPTRVSQNELVAFLEQTLSDLRDPAAWIRRNDEIEAVGGAAIIMALETMFQDRRQALGRVFEGFPAWPENSAVGTWAYLKKMEWANLAIDATELDTLANFVYAYQQDAAVRSRLERSLLDAILRCGTCEQLDVFWRNASAVRKATLGINGKIALVRKLRATPRREAEAQGVLDEFQRQATPFEHLKLVNMELLGGTPMPGWDHRRAEQQFAQLAPQQVAREFARDVSPLYDALRPQMRFMDIRTKAEEAGELRTLIREAVGTKKPFSLVRLSDGEGYLFPGGTYFGPEDSVNRERHWWGRELPADLRAKIIEEAREAISSADVIGIPSVYRFIRDHGDTSRSLTQTIQGRGLLEVLHGVPQAIGPAALITEDKVNVSLFGHVEALTELIEAAGRVVFVGSVKPEHLPPVLKDVRRLETILLPTHSRTSVNDKYYSAAEPLPFLYAPLLDRLDALAGPGVLALVAGGIVGKIFCGRARAKGAVALDMGSVIDDWLQTRVPTMR